MRLACSLLLLCPLLAFAVDWPAHRGPTGDGVYVGPTLPLTWDETKNVTWKTAIPGKGWSSPVVVGGKVYLTTAVPADDGPTADQSLRALCVDAASGKILWNTQVFLQDGKTAPRIHPKNSHASPTPLVDQGKLFVHFGHMGTACLDLSGRILWKTQELKYHPVHGNGGSPVLVGDKLIFSIDGLDKQVVVALNRDTGKVVWKTDRRSTATKKFSFGTPLVLTLNGKPAIVSTGSDVVMACDAETGAEIWRVHYTGYSITPKPLFGNGLVYLSTSFDNAVLYAIRPDGRGDVTKSHVAFTVKSNAPHTPSMLLRGDELYMVADKGIISCLDARTGKLHWSERIQGGYSASPLLAEDRIYVTNESGTTIVLQAGKEFKELARNTLKERIFASFAPVDGVLFLRSEGHLYRIEEKR